MKILKKMSRLGIALLILNEIRGILVVTALLSGGAQALAHQGPAGGSPAAVRVAFGF
jgi:hypothetical protein